MKIIKEVKIKDFLKEESETIEQTLQNMATNIDITIDNFRKFVNPAIEKLNKMNLSQWLQNHDNLELFVN